MDGTAASRLVDWDASARVARLAAGSGPEAHRSEQTQMNEDFRVAVEDAESVIASFTGLSIEGPPTRPWVMSRSQWIDRSLRGFETAIEPLARRFMERNRDGPTAGIRRKVLAGQVGALLGYVARRVLGQYDLFLPPDDRDLLYFVGPNVLAVERKFRFTPQDFRLWLCLHEVTHRVQFSGVPWLRDHVMGLIDTYLESVELDPRRLVEIVRRAVDEARRGRRWQGMGIVFLLMTEKQRETFKKMQAVMSLLEGHGNYVMHTLARDRIRGADRMRRALDRRRAGVNRVFQRAIGLEAKVAQYGLGERFVSRVVERVGSGGFARVWERPEHLPSLGEVYRPDQWVERVAAP
ncbi:MAG TPA: zinc-dependent metalloprotease [Actinomycetota bacterium]|jgi:coenzyme F420 biosynthesis associated uncharacterized protein|nr:zinc-dependent metalloprotease [Actinomycetota bacterium]